MYAFFIAHFAEPRAGRGEFASDAKIRFLRVLSKAVMTKTMGEKICRAKTAHLWSER